MGLFSRKNRKEDNEQAALLAKLDGRLVKYVTRRELNEAGSPVETILGKEGRIHTLHGEIIVRCGTTEVFRCAAEGASCGELLSLEGVVLKGVHPETGKPDTVVAYYKYYR